MKVVFHGRVTNKRDRTNLLKFARVYEVYGKELKNFIGKMHNWLNNYTKSINEFL